MGHSGQWEAPIRAWNDAIGRRGALREESANFEFRIKEEISGSHRVILPEIVQGYSYGLLHGLGGLGYGEFPRLVDHYGICLLPMQDSGTSQIKVYPTHVADRMHVVGYLDSNSKKEFTFSISITICIYVQTKYVQM